MESRLETMRTFLIDLSNEVKDISHLMEAITHLLNEIDTVLGKNHMAT